MMWFACALYLSFSKIPQHEKEFPEQCRIADPDVIPVLARGLEGGEHYNQIAALDAIMEIDPQKGLSHAFAELNDAYVDVRRNAIITCIKTGDPAVVDALSALLEDEDFEVRFYARQGIKRLKN